MEIIIKKVQLSKIKKFAAKQWPIINRRFGLLPPKKTFFLGAYSKNKLVGYVKLDIKGKLVEIRQIIVDDNWVRKGIGIEMMRYIERLAIKSKCKRIVLKVPSVYEGAIKFYKKHGYKKDVTLVNYYYGYDWYYMIKDL